MTIDVGYAHMVLPDGTELDFVDVPGHDRLVGNMLVGAGEIDAAMLVVAADDGPRAQTLEHLALLDALAIGQGIAVVTKTDIAGPERTADVVALVGRLLDRTTLSGSPVVAVSSIDGAGIDACGRRSWRCATRWWRPRPAWQADRAARLAIDRVFAVEGVAPSSPGRCGDGRSGGHGAGSADDQSVRVRSAESTAPRWT
jgi:selenocysteine-specific elongation factor